MMSFRHSIALVFGALLMLARIAAAAPVDSPKGLWLNEKGTVAVRLADCGGSVCGSVVWLKKPRHSDGSLKRDEHNPDPAQRDRPLCGLRILGGFKPGGDKRWTRGWVYDPGEGNTYRSTMEVVSAEEIKVRGYTLLPMFGRTVRWTRLTEPPPGGCAAEEYDHATPPS